MATNDLVSVIVPVFNRARYLRATLESIVTQDYHPIEIIVVDDGSTDGTGAVAREFATVRYRYQENAGVSAARNVGISMAQGTFMSFFDSDDLMLPYKIGLQVRYLHDHPRIDCVVARHEILMEDGFTPPRELARDAVFGDLEGVQLESAVIRRSVVDRVGGFDASYRLAEGFEWMSRVRSAGLGIAVLDEIVARRRIHETNVSHDRRALQAAYVRVLRERASSARAAPPGRDDAP